MKGRRLHSSLRLRALLVRARGDEAAYRGYRDRYRAMASSLVYEGCMKWAEAMLCRRSAVLRERRPPQRPRQ